MDWTDMTSSTSPENSNSIYPLNRNRRNRKRHQRGLFAVLAVIGIVTAVIYYVYFRAYDKGPRTVKVNGENVQQINGFLIHSKTWLSRSQARDFLKRIDASGVSLPKAAKSYHGAPYIRVRDFVSRLNQYGDESQFSNGQLIVTLKSGQHYSYRSNADQIHQEDIRVNGSLVHRFLAVYHHEAPYVPVKTAARILTQAGLKSSWNGKQLDVSLTKKPSLTPVQQSAADHVIAFGTGNAIYAPSYTWQGIVYLPLYSLNNVLHHLGWSASISSWNWALSPNKGTLQDPTNTSTSTESTSSNNGVIAPLSIRSASKPQVLAFVPFYAGNMSAFQDAINYQSSYDALAEDTWTISASGSLNGSPPSGTASQAVSDGFAVYAMVTNIGSKGFDANEMTSVLTNSVNRTRLHNELVNLVESENYDGIMLDFEAIPVTDRTAYSEFVSSLAADLHAEGKRLEVAVPALTGTSNSVQNSAYDLAQLGQAADNIVVMAYDYSYFGGPSGPIAPIPWVQQVLAYTVSQMPANKVILGLDAYGYDWTGKHTTAVSLTNVDSFLKKHHIQPKWDKSADAPWFKWTDSKGAVHTVYYENGRSTQDKLKLATIYGTSGVAVWRAGLEDNAVLKVLAHYEHTAHS